MRIIYLLLAAILLSSCATGKISRGQAYEDIYATYVADHLLQEIRPINQDFIFSKEVAYIDGKVYPVKDVKIKRRRKSWLIGSTWYEYYYKDKILERYYRFNNDYKNPPIFAYTYLVE